MGKLNRLLRAARDIWLILGVVLLLLVALEGMLSLLFLGWDSAKERSHQSLFNSQAMAEAYPQSAWLDDYFREAIESRKTEWVSYVYWRRMPYRGTHINIDENGIRKTWAPGGEHAGSGKPLTLFMFGGSTMWGSGARDDFTIPSCLAKQLHERGIPCVVTNFGEAGYVTTQEVIELVRQIHQGNIPDLVIFYDGINDTYSSYQNQMAGLPQNEFNRVREFNLSQPGSFAVLRQTFVCGAIRRLSTVRFFGRLRDRLGLADPPHSTAVRQAGAEDSLAGQETLCCTTLAVYQAHIRIVKALAAQYGFKVLFYWQPNIFDKKHLTACEEAQRRDVAALQPFVQKTYELVRRADLAAANAGIFRDLSQTFSDVQKPVFLDWCHVSEWGNERIADGMAADVLAMLGAEARPAGTQQKGP